MSHLRATLTALVTAVCLMGAPPKQADAYSLAFYADALATDAYIYAYYGYVSTNVPTANESAAYYYSYYGYIYADYAYNSGDYSFQDDAYLYCYYASYYGYQAYFTDARSSWWYFAALFDEYASDLCYASYQFSPYGL
jgi:hypothetical protein